ncbi:GTP-binding protein [Streptomyces pratensis]|uniref:GTP-binding protein n=1 Tax=Streptomyces pratensis TaxID=1169025 RepID=UPI003626FB54
MADIGCVHQAVRLWNGWDRTAPLTQAEAAARQVESADVLYVPAGKDAVSRYASGVASLVEQINGTAQLLDPSADEKHLVHPLPDDFAEQWLARLDPMVIPGIRRGSAYLEPSAESVLWCARRPVHPQRLADALAKVMRGVVRSRGHLWLSSRPDSVVTWRSARTPGPARGWQVAGAGRNARLAGRHTSETRFRVVVLARLLRGAAQRLSSPEWISMSRPLDWHSTRLC